MIRFRIQCDIQKYKTEFLNYEAAYFLNLWFE